MNELITNLDQITLPQAIMVSVFIIAIAVMFRWAIPVVIIAGVVVLVYSTFFSIAAALIAGTALFCIGFVIIMGIQNVWEFVIKLQNTNKVTKKQNHGDEG